MKSLVVVSSVWVEPKSSAAGQRMLQLIRFFKSLDYQITYLSTAQLSPNRFDLTTIDVKEEIIVLNDASFDERIVELQPDVVMYDRFLIEEQFGWRVRESCPEAFTILDTEDLHSLRKSRHLAHKQQVDFTIEFWKNQEITLRELASIYRCDCSLIISEVELNYLKENFQVPSYLLTYLPILVEKVENEYPSFLEREHFVTIGNFLHEPNWDSVLFLKQEVWSLIRARLPKVELHVYGAYPTQKVLQLNNPKEGFFIKGKADEVDEVMKKARVCLAPLRFGGGLKGKFFDAMRNGTPSVTTSIGMEGIADAQHWAGEVADTPLEIAEQAVALYTQQEKWIIAQQKAENILNQGFGTEKHLVRFKEELEKSMEHKNSNRSKNFIGKMFGHQTMNSSKYFSRWIEEKNKKTTL